jgi:5'-3' exoribonuclease 2
MGVPAFYRWISEKYPKIVATLLEQYPTVIADHVFPVDLTEANPNQIEFDNLYVDMNGLIHPCSHPEDREAPRSEEEMYKNVTKYLDRLMCAIRPRKVLFLAIDGVAPRAKMNQQRSRRFRSAQEAKEKQDMMAEVLEEMVKEGFDTSEHHTAAKHSWDSNVITPGTEFMINISLYIKHYILEKMNSDKLWANITVIFSDASEPGEGEHKIMNFIRSQRNEPDYNPNIHHVLHGLDADLIMLALATHESRFTILREKVTFGKKDKDKDRDNDSNDPLVQQQRLLNARSMRNDRLVKCVDPADEWVYGKPLQALHIHVLREYLDGEFASLQPVLPFPYELERIIDDFIFMCFFVGNDFLPHLPSLDIRDGALDFLLECYKDILPSLGNYVTSPGGIINLSQADVLLSRVGEVEDQIFLRKKRAEDAADRKFQHLQAQQQAQKEFHQAARQQSQQLQMAAQPSHDKSVASSSVENPHNNANSNCKVDNDRNQLAAQSLRESLLGKRQRSEPTDASSSLNEDSVEPKSAGDIMETTADDKDRTEIETDDADGEDEETDRVVDTESIPDTPAIKKQKLSAADHTTELSARMKNKEQSLIDRYKHEITDSVKFHESGWKDRYYQEPFKQRDLEQGGGLTQMCVSYVTGLLWVMQYYYAGVPSWNWYYPFHYAPFASDLVNIDTYKLPAFTLSQPFRPLQQLLAVLPASSAHALPTELQCLMTDPTVSPIIDIYDETNVPLDPNGKHLPWLWILLLPFLEENRIVQAFDSLLPQLTLHSRRRNALGPAVVFAHAQTPLGQFILQHSDEQHQQLGNSLGQIAPETDCDVIAALQSLDSDMHEQSADDATAVKLLPATPVTKDANVPLVRVTCTQSGGHITGYLGPAPAKYFSLLDTPIPPPGVNSETLGFHHIASNSVLTVQYHLLSAAETGTHRSCLLPGIIPLPSPLLDHDKGPKRPPRLNRSGFNVLELFQSIRQSHGNNQQQYDRYDRSNYSHRNNNSRDQGGYGRNNNHNNYNQNNYQRGDYGRQNSNYDNYNRNSYNTNNNYNNNHNNNNNNNNHNNSYRNNNNDYYGQQQFQQQPKQPEFVETNFVPQVTRVGGAPPRTASSSSASAAHSFTHMQQQRKSLQSMTQTIQQQQQHHGNQQNATHQSYGGSQRPGGFSFSHPSQAQSQQHQDNYHPQSFQQQHFQQSHQWQAEQSHQHFHQQPLQSQQQVPQQSLQQMREAMMRTLQQQQQLSGNANHHNNNHNNNHNHNSNYHQSYGGRRY